MCYTSATTAKPKGVVYTHRIIFLHSLALSMADTAAISETDRLMPVVPIFHVNAWGMPFVATKLGTTQVLPSPLITQKMIAKMIETYEVIIIAGVQSIMVCLLQELNQGSYDTSSLCAILCGRSAAPNSMMRAFESIHNIPCMHAYGKPE